MNSTKAKRLLAALPIVAQALARKAQVEIVFDSHLNTAATDGRRILLPVLPIPTTDDPSEALEKLAVLAYGYIDHEVGHVLFSDFGALERAKNHHGLLNAIEDPRQELDMIRTYPGTRRTLDALSVQLINDDTQGVQEGMPPTDLVTMTVHAWLRANLRNEPAYRSISDEGMSLIEATLGIGVRHRLLALIEGPGMQMADTEDALKLTLSIIQMLQEETEKAQQEAQQEAQQDGQGDQQDDPRGQQDGQDGQDGQGDQQDDPRGQQDGQDSQDGQGGQGGQGGQDDPQGDPQGQQDDQGGQGHASQQQRAEALSDAATGKDAIGFKDRGITVSQHIAEASNDLKSEGPTFSLGNQVVRRDEPMKSPELGGPLDANQAERASAKLRRKLNVLLETKSRVYNRIKDSGQRLSLRHLTNIAVQDARVFEHRGQIRRVDTAVMILGDCSSSMFGAEIKVSNGGIYAASKALEALRGVKVAAMTFPGNGLIKGFDQPVLSVQEKFKPRANGNTPLTEALFTAARMLRNRREPRRIILVLTDGAPNNAQSAKAVLDALPGLGIEAYGIGILHQDVRSLFAKSSVVQSVEDLPEAIFSMLQKQLAA